MDSSRTRNGRCGGYGAILLYGWLQSWPLALLVMANLPFAAVGRVVALWLRGLHLSVSASIGFIALFGVAVLNGLVLLTTVQRLRQDGLEAGDAALRGARERLRPVLMTALVASIGFLPVAVSHGVGAEVQRPLDRGHRWSGHLDAADTARAPHALRLDGAAQVAGCRHRTG